MNKGKHKRTLLAVSSCAFDSTAAWVEGVEFENPMPPRSRWSFGIASGELCTNTGIQFSRETLQKIVDNMPEDAVLKVCGCFNVEPEQLKEKFENRRSIL